MIEPMVIITNFDLVSTYKSLTILFDQGHSWVDGQQVLPLLSEIDYYIRINTYGCLFIGDEEYFKDRFKDTDIIMTGEEFINKYEFPSTIEEKREEIDWEAHRKFCRGI